jgi:hypothetical protein
MPHHAGDHFGAPEDSAMLATVLVHMPLAMLPIVQLSEPTRDCRLEVLPPLVIEERLLSDFAAGVQAYAALARRVVRGIGPALSFNDESRFLDDELRVAILAARPLAHQGDFFTPPVADVFRRRIDRALLLGVARTAAPLYEPLPGEPGPEVNGPFPAVAGAVHWPELLRELPPLPFEVSYALWGRTLVLMDVQANLVLDVLQDALPEGAYPGVIYQ